MQKKRVLFVCVKNSARSQMAEGFVNNLGGDILDGESAGFEPEGLSQLAVNVMQEIGIDISHHTSDSVFEFYKTGKKYHYIITLCDEGISQKCPIFPGVLKRIHWSYEDPALMNCSEDEKMDRVRKIRDSIKTKVEELIQLVKTGKLEENAPKEWKFLS